MTKVSLRRVVELYLSDKKDRFEKGFYYDEKGEIHELECLVHLGMTVDSCVIRPKDDSAPSVCRYFLNPYYVEFYNSHIERSRITNKMLIHNETDKPMEIKYDDMTQTIPPHKSILVSLRVKSDEEIYGF